MERCSDQRARGARLLSVYEVGEIADSSTHDKIHRRHDRAHFPGHTRIHANAGANPRQV
jgi:hypothetical protein